MLLSKQASLLHWCAGQPAAGPAQRAGPLPSAARDGAGGHISGSNAELLAHTATRQCRSLPHWNTKQWDQTNWLEHANKPERFFNRSVTEGFSLRY